MPGFLTFCFMATGASESRMVGLELSIHLLYTVISESSQDSHNNSNEL